MIQLKKLWSEARKGVGTVQSPFLIGEPKISSDKEDDLQNCKTMEYYKLVSQRSKLKCQCGLDESGGHRISRDIN